MCDFFGRGHEFFLKMKKAGFTDDMYQQVINAKNNALAKAMFEAFLKAAEQEAYELVYQNLMPIAEVTESKFIKMCQEQFYHEAWRFDERLTSIFGQSSALRGWYQAKVYRLKSPMPVENVRKFIKSNGSFPGAFGAASFWMFEAIKELASESVLEKFTASMKEISEKNHLSLDFDRNESVFLPQGIRIFSFEEKEISLQPCLIRFKGQRPNWHFDLSKAANPDGIFPAGEAILIMVPITSSEIPCISQIKVL